MPIGFLRRVTPIEITRGIVNSVAEEFRLDPTRILGRQRGKYVHARIAIAKALDARGYTAGRIAKILGRDRTTIVFYLGRTKKHQPAKPKWKAPRVVIPKGCGDLVEPAGVGRLTTAKPKLYLVPYAGADPEYVWQRRSPSR